MTIRLGFLTTHPIQYQVPVFRHLAADPGLEFTAIYGMLPGASAQGAGFGIDFSWDIPLMDGYRYEVLENVSRSPCQSSFYGVDTPGIGSVVRKLRLDALVVNGWVAKSCLQGLRAARKLGIPCLVRGEANDLCPRVWWKRGLQRLLVQQYSACLYIGRANRKFYRRRGVSEDRLFASPYCVENERLQKQSKDRSHRRMDLRRQWGIAEQACCYLYCGKFQNKKHPVELLHSFSLAVSRNQNLHLLMVGDGELRRQCEEIARQMSLPVTFAGFLNQSEIVDAYVACDCLVMPSDYGETWGLVVNEAFACARPAVVSSLVGCREDLIHEGVTGRSFPFGDWAGLANILEELARQPQILAEMGRRAQQLIQEFSPETAARGISEAADVIVQRRSTKQPDHVVATRALS